MATIVLAHGAWSAAWAWKKVRPLMAAAGHQFFTPTYTGLGERAHLASPSNDLETHIADVLGVLTCEELRDVVLIGHSYGGMVASGVADRARDRLAQLIYLDAFVPADGQALIDLVPDAERDRLLGSVESGDGWRVTPNPTPPDTSPQDLEWVEKFRMPQSVKCFTQPLRLQAALTLPRVFIHCTRYADKKPFAQFARRARSETGWQCHDLDASHSPNVTAPAALVALLQRILPK
ncbi:MAG TPA: alpha/beta hydrolase [Xanthobacteraceae bacterium]|nr:alpha/beta hydrolase [Xanthobacteraceae bacterium]